MQRTYHYGTKVLRMHARLSCASIAEASVEALVPYTMCRALAIVYIWRESITHFWGRLKEKFLVEWSLDLRFTEEMSENIA